MPFVVLYDANALYPNAQRDLLIRIARAGLVQAKWTEEILAEMARARLRRNQDLPKERIERLCQLMRDAVADCLVTGYEDLVENLKLPDTRERPPNTVPGVLEELERSGLVRSAAALRSLMP
jgi:hypothetical protein